MIPENIRTLPRVASWNSEGMGGFLRLEFRRHGGCFDLDFQRGKRTRDSLDDADCVRQL